MQSLMERIQESVTPTSVSNAIYEIMIDWRAYTMRINNDEPHKTRMRDKRKTLEVCLARFFNTDTREVRKMLEQHFDMKAGKR